MQVINFFGGPSSGKSTCSAGLFHKLKMAGEDVELVTEVAKDYVWSGHFEMLNNQILVTAQQYERIRKLENKVKYAITDSPLLLGIIYAPENYFKSYYDLVFEMFNSFNNINIFITRTKKYNPNGRVQTEKESISVDYDIKEMLHHYSIDYTNMTIEEINKLKLRELCK